LDLRLALPGSVVARRAWQISILTIVLATRGMGQTPDPSAAQTALDRGDYQRAEELYRALADSGVSSPEVLSNLGITLHLQGKSSEAIKVFGRALRLKELPGTLALLGLSYCRLQQFDDAIPILQRAKRYFADSNVLSVLGPCYLDAGEPLDAVLVYKELVKRAVPPADENLANLARANFRASKHFLGLLEKVPGNKEYLGAIETARQNSSPDARGAFAVALRNAPYLSVDAGVEELGKLLLKHPTDPALLYVLGVVCGEQAMQDFRLSQSRYAGSVGVRRLYAEMLASRGRYEEAIVEYESLIQSSSAPSGVHHDLALLYRRRGDWDKALLEFELEQRAAPDDERAVVGISECLLRLERYEALSRHLRPITLTKEPPEWALLDAATAAKELGRVDDAIGYLRQATLHYPDSPTVHYRLGRLYRLAGRKDLARQEDAIFSRLKDYQKNIPKEPEGR
jgi:tetratricopeptide (TPR) repeat protein